MKTAEVETSSLIPYEQNNRTHPPEQIERIAKSITEFGFNQPIVVDESNTVLVGHGRLIAAQNLWLKKVPVYKKNGLSETQKRAYRILDNKLQNDSAWDFQNLELELAQLEADGFDLPEWGLDDLKALMPEPEAEIVEDEAPPLPDETFIKRGDLIELGRHRVLCGDSAAELDFLALAHVMVTDPPYGIGEDYASHDDTEENLIKLVENIIKPALALTPRAAITSGVGQLFHYPRAKWVAAWINEAGVGRSAWGFSCWQPVLLYGDDPYLANGRGCRPDIIKGNIASEKNGHPCPKPLKVWADIIERVSMRSEIISDPFLGSGTTLIACEQLGRTCYGMEIEPKYCQVVLERYQNYCKEHGKPFVCKINGEPYA